MTTGRRRSRKEKIRKAIDNVDIVCCLPPTNVGVAVFFARDRGSRTNAELGTRTYVHGAKRVLTTGCDGCNQDSSVLWMQINNQPYELWLLVTHITCYLPFDSSKNRQYPREAWRPIPEGSCPAFEQGLALPAQVWDPAGDLHPHLRRRSVSGMGISSIFWVSICFQLQKTKTRF